jgi:hypothetical protein
MRRSRKESPAAESSECGRPSPTKSNVSQGHTEAAGEPPLASDADLLAEGKTIVERTRRAAKERAVRNELEEEYNRTYRALRDEILDMQGERDSAHFHGQVYDDSPHVPRLVELLVSYFHVLQKSEHMRGLHSLDERALLQYYAADDKSGLARVCLRYTLRFLRTGVRGVSKARVEQKVREVNENEQLAGVWRWILGLGFELGPDKWQQAVVTAEPRTQVTTEEPKPIWDKLNRELTYKGRRLRKYRGLAKTQIQVLDTFQELNWVKVVDSPFPGTTKGKNQLKNTIKNLNKRLEQEGVIEFYADGSGIHVCWRGL